MKHTTSWLLLLIATGVSCKDGGIESDYSNISDAYARWQAYNLKNYTLEQRLICFCANGGVPMKIVVRENRILNVVNLSDGTSLPSNQWSSYKTVDELFDITRSIKKDSVASFRLEHDLKYGYPSILFVDPSADIADEEFGFGTENLSRN